VFRASIRVVLWQGLDIEDIDRGASDPAIVEGIQEGSLVKQKPRKVVLDDGNVGPITDFRPVDDARRYALVVVQHGNVYWMERQRHFGTFWSGGPQPLVQVYWVPSLILRIGARLTLTV